MARRCENCGQIFTNKYQLGPHRRRCYNRQLPATSSDFSVSDDDAGGENFDGSEHSDEHTDDSEQDNEIKIFELAQRLRGGFWGNPEKVVIPNRPVFVDTCATYSYVPTQRAFRTYVRDVFELCTPQFWQLFLTVKQQPATCADLVLDTVFKLLSNQTQMPNFRLGHRWPRSTRTLRQKVFKKLGCFWDVVQETCRIDVRQFGLPGLRYVTFTFIDPIYVWIEQCEQLHRCGHEFHWKPQVLRNPDTNEAVFGAGIQYGMLMKTAYATTPSGTRVALMNISWDGGDTGYKTRSCSPICCQAGQSVCAFGMHACMRLLACLLA